MDGIACKQAPTSIVPLSASSANLRPDYAGKTLTAELHRLGSALQDAAVEQLCATPNATAI